MLKRSNNKWWKRPRLWRGDLLFDPCDFGIVVGDVPPWRDDLYMVGARGVEPLTFCVSSKRSNQLSYAPEKCGLVRVDGLEPSTPTL